MKTSKEKEVRGYFLVHNISRGAKKDVLKF
jgi:hypothetical protein